MKAYFIAILTLFTCMATVVRAQQMSELENRIDSLLNGKKATVGIAVWTDKETCSGITTHTLPLLSVFKFHVALAVLDKMDKQSISLDIVSIKASQMLPNTYSPLRRSFPTRISRLRLGADAIQHFPKRQQCLRHLDRICRSIKHINDYIRRLGIDSFNLSKQKTTCTPASRLYTATGVLLPAMARLLRTADEKELFSARS